MLARFPLFLAIFLLMTSCSLIPPDSQDIEAKKQLIDSYEGRKEQAVFAGGCFWCIEASFEKIDGVIAAISGFAGGSEANPSYNLVSSGTTEYIESVLVIYDPDEVSYRELVDAFWKMFDPTDAGGSFNDRGHQYTSAIFFATPEQKKIAEESKAAADVLGAFDKPIVTPIREVTEFYPAEEYHQDYYKKNPIRYKYYRNGSGRDDFIESVWGPQS